MPHERSQHRLAHQIVAIPVPDERSPNRPAHLTVARFSLFFTTYIVRKSGRTFQFVPPHEEDSGTASSSDDEPVVLEMDYAAFEAPRGGFCEHLTREGLAQTTSTTVFLAFAFACSVCGEHVDPPSHIVTRTYNVSPPDTHTRTAALKAGVAVQGAGVGRVGEGCPDLRGEASLSHRSEARPSLPCRRAACVGSWQVGPWTLQSLEAGVRHQSHVSRVLPGARRGVHRVWGCPANRVVALASSRAAFGQHPRPVRLGRRNL